MSKKQYFFDREENVKKVRWTFYACLIFLFIIDYFIATHPHFEWEGVYAFYAIYGFVGCVSLVLIAKVLRLIVMREEDYYD